MSALKLSAACLASCLTIVLGNAVSAHAAEPASSAGSGLNGNPLVIPDMQPLIGGQQTQATEEVLRQSPEAFTARQASRTAFEGMTTAAAMKLASETFPELIDRPAGTLPALPPGERIVGYANDKAAQIDLTDGKHAVIESTEPLAVETPGGHHEPLDLKLSNVVGSFQPALSDVSVRIPARLDEGIRLSHSGVSVTPIDGHGSALSGSEATVNGATVLYANTQTDSDTLVKPLTTGFEEDTLLRSVQSPSKLIFRIGLPSGASLRPPKGGAGAIGIVEADTVIATIATPTAHDAEGRQVPVSTTVSGDTLTLSVDQRASSYRYPIVVDPTVIEKGGFENEILYEKTWGFYTENSSVFKVERYYISGTGNPEYGFKDEVGKSVAAGERAFFYYPTQGQSRIYSVTASTSFQGYAGSKMEDVLGIENVHTGKPENSKAWIENYNAPNETVCALSGCATGTVTESTNKSEVFFTQDSRETNEWGGGTAKLTTATVSILQEAGPSTSFVPFEKWVKNEPPSSPYLSLKATDPGLGIYSSNWTSPQDLEWKPPGGYIAPCSGVQCEESETVTGTLQGLPEGEDVVEALTKDPVGLSSTAKTTVKIDNARPYNLTLTGFPADHEIGFGHYLVKVSATDGSGTTPSAGIASIALAIDGKEVGSPKGSCTPGPCTATGEWTIDGEEYAAGKHSFTMTATDGAGNVTKEEFPLTIESSEMKPLGPGSVDLTSGAYTLNATDVSIAGAGGGLTMQRSYNSRHLTAGVEGPLGPQWSGLGLGGTQSLSKLPTGSMLLTAANGRQSMFAKEGTKFTAPIGDATMTLKEEGSNVFVLTEQNGTVITFTLPAGGSGTLFTPSSREEKGYANTYKYTYQTVGGVTEPTQALAPVAAGITCTTLVKGCRALTFSYAASTTATGEAESGWGEYAGRLTHIYFTAWEPAKSEMATTTVAQYSYDARGRLRAEWDPRISPALKTTYGYDSEGHVTALTSPGQETWAFTYTSIESDPNTGRLVKAMQAPAATSLWNGLVLSNTEAPKLSGSSMVKVRMAVSNGTWSNGAVTYGYQWERCNSAGKECAAISGAINPNYTPTESDIGHTLFATVTATNGDGSITSSSVTSGIVSASEAPIYVSSTAVKPPGFKDPASVAVDSKGHIWVTDTIKSQIVEYAESGEFLRRVGSLGTGAGQFAIPKGIAVDSKGDVWVADTGNERIQEFNEAGEYLQSFGSMGTGNGQFKSPYDVAVDSKGNVWVADHGNDRIQEFNEKGEYQRQVATRGTSLPPAGVTVDSSGNVWVTVDSESGVQEFNEKAEFLQKWGGVNGEGNGQLAEPQGIVIKEKHIWVAETKNNRIQEFNEKGEYVSKFGTTGEENGQFKAPGGIAISPKSTLWVADTSNNRLQEFTEAGVYRKQISNQTPVNGELSYGAGVAVDLKDNVWAVDDGTSKLVRFNEKGEYLSTVGSEGSAEGQFKDPMGIAADPKGNMWVADTNNSRLEKFNENTTYASKFGTSGTGEGQFKSPWATAVDSKGNIWVADTWNDRVQEFNEKGEFIKAFGFGVSNGEEKLQTCTSACRSGIAGNGNGQLYVPEGIAVDAKGHIWVADTLNNRIQEFNEKGEFLLKFGKSGTGQGEFKVPGGMTVDSSGDLWVVDTENDRVQEFNEKGEFKTAFGSKGSGPGQFETRPGSSVAIDPKGNVWVTNTEGHDVEHWQIITKTEAEARQPASGSTVVYGVPMSGTGAPYSMTSAELEKWAQKDDPTEATAIFPPDEPQSSPATDYRRATVYYLDNHGRTVNVANPSGAISTAEYNSTDDVVRTLSPDDRASALKEGVKSTEVSKLLDTQSVYNEEGSELLSTTGPRHTVKLANGKEVQARSHTVYSYDEGAPAEGSPYRLVTKVTQGAQIEGEGEQDIRTTTTAYSGQDNLGWKLRKPTSVTIDPSGLKLTHTTLYSSTTGDVTETRLPASKGANEAHDTKTIYYTTASNSEYPSCGGHAEWANLPCETKPAAQPGTSGLPELPVAVITYNMLDEPEVTTQTVGSTTRTTKITYDAAGRPLTSSISSTVGTALPTVTYEYNTETGAVAKATAEGKSISEIYNKIGQVTSYTDASGNISTFEYEPEGDARLTKVSDGKGTQTYSYDTTTGDLTKLVDSAAGTFTASYDVEGNLLSEGYPNGMNGTYTYNSVGEALGLEYVKTTHCTEKCTWYSDTLVPSIHGQTSSQASTLASQNYTYDNASRLTQVQETPVGKGCITRIYGYDEDTNRTSLTVREPGVEGKCATEGGTKETHAYDAADRLTDTGAKYETFGNITGLSAADAGGSELTSSFYTNNRLASQSQGGETIGYQLDPERRVSETVSTGKVAATVTNHYDGSSSTPAWTSELSGKWTRNIEGLGVGLAATQYNGETPVLQLTDLKGDIVATASESETETKLLGTSRTTEYGVPTTEAPAKYSWLGAHEIPTELPSGIVGMGARSYVPQLGRFLQTDPRAGGSANAYAYTYGDPVNTTDLSGEYTVGGPSRALIDGTAQMASEAAAEQAAINAAARAEAERKAAEEAALAGLNDIGEEWEEEEWEEEGEEDAAYHSAAKPGEIEGERLEEGLSWQPFQEEADGKGESQVVALCKTGQGEQCARYVASKKGKKKAKKKASWPGGPKACPTGEVANPFNGKCGCPEGQKKYAGKCIASAPKSTPPPGPPQPELSEEPPTIPILPEICEDVPCVI
jgi:RHS repeat-associated protein